MPERTCVACGRKRAKFELLRVTRNASGEIDVDPRQRKPGRGAYLCPDPSCIEQARKRKSLSRALRTSVPAEVYVRLMAVLQDEAVVN